MLRSPHAAARIGGIDTTRAADAPGVVAVYTATDLRPILRDLPPKVTHPQLNRQTRLPIAVDCVRYVGEPVAVVVADTRYLAEDAMELIDIDYEPLPAIASPWRQARPWSMRDPTATWPCTSCSEPGTRMPRCWPPRTS